jgi:hypothetical protein
MFKENLSVEIARIEEEIVIVIVIGVGIEIEEEIEETTQILSDFSSTLEREMV